jgi:hypothetical protein
MMSFLLAAIQQQPGTAAPAAPDQPAAPADLIRDIAAPVSVPLPFWQQALIVIAGLLVLALLIWLVRKFMPRPVIGPPPTPRSIALRELEKLRIQVRAMDPYAFSIAVSDVLRSYVGSQFGLRAREQTSPEFRAAISGAKNFDEQDQRLLADFLERADLIKFARVDAGPEESERLLSAAAAFVQGGRA